MGSLCVCCRYVSRCASLFGRVSMCLLLCVCVCVFPSLIHTDPSSRYPPHIIYKTYNINTGTPRVGASGRTARAEQGFQPQCDEGPRHHVHLSHCLRPAAQEIHTVEVIAISIHIYIFIYICIGEGGKCLILSTYNVNQVLFSIEVLLQICILYMRK